MTNAERETEIRNTTVRHAIIEPIEKKIRGACDRLEIYRHNSCGDNVTFTLGIILKDLKESEELLESAIVIL